MTRTGDPPGQVLLLVRRGDTALTRLGRRRPAPQGTWIRRWPARGVEPVTGDDLLDRHYGSWVGQLKAEVLNRWSPDDAPGVESATPMSANRSSRSKLLHPVRPRSGAPESQAYPAGGISR